MDLNIVSRRVRISPTKLRRLFYHYRNKNIEEAISLARHLPGKGNQFILKALLSGKSLAKDREMDLDKTKVKRLTADKSLSLKRRIIKARGRVGLIQKRFSHLALILSDFKEDEFKKKKVLEASKLHREKVKKAKKPTKLKKIKKVNSKVKTKVRKR